MIKVKFIFFAFWTVLCCAGEANAAGLDEIYRDLVRSDNRGYLPLFVKNRYAPSVVDEDKEVSPVEDIEESVKNLDEELKDVNFQNERLIRNAEIEANEIRWKKVLGNVQSGYVSSFELDELIKREQEDNPQAVEVLAWIYSKGIGVEPDLIRAFHLYKKAVNLKVSGAMENAVKVYKAMSQEQKEELNK